MGLFFYLFSFFVILSAVGVVFLKNSVHSVMCLILSFINTAGLFILMGADFLAFLLIIVYVGAVIVMFLFVVMMADFKVSSALSGIGFFEGGLIFAIITAFTLCVLFAFNIYSLSDQVIYTSVSVRDLAAVLYTEHYLVLEIAGFILLIAMVGAIALVLEKTDNVKRQKLFNQLKKPNRAKMVSVKSKKGVSI
ncbi:NADH-quinone oxidoreductase subunit J [Anaplasmataceae bacterium AB001_6]|nr:NADH-quinone oxidoreductase subunit J [Anaplasmataceae bacterium AB001_6]